MNRFLRPLVLAGMATVLIAPAHARMLVEVKKKSGEKGEVTERRVLGGKTERESRDKFYEIQLRSMSPQLQRVDVEYFVLMSGLGGKMRPGGYEKLLVSTPMGQPVTVETKAVELTEATWTNERRIIAPRIGSTSSEEELVGIAIVLTTPEGQKVSETFEPRSKEKELRMGLERAREEMARREAKLEAHPNAPIREIGEGGPKGRRPGEPKGLPRGLRKR